MTLYNAHPVVVTGQIWAASDQMTYVAGNLQALYVYSTKGDIAAAKAANELARVAIGTDGTIWIADAAQTAGVRAGQLPIELSMGSALFAMSGITAASVEQTESSAASPKPNELHGVFGNTPDSWLMFQKILPSLMGDSPVLRIHGYMATATTGNIGFGVRVSARKSADANMTSRAFAATNTASAAVPGVAGTKFTLDIALTNLDNWTKDADVIIGLYRDTAVGSNAAGNCIVEKAQIVYG